MRNRPSLESRLHLAAYAKYALLLTRAIACEWWHRVELSSPLASPGTKWKPRITVAIFASVPVSKLPVLGLNREWQPRIPPALRLPISCYSFDCTVGSRLHRPVGMGQR